MGNLKSLVLLWDNLAEGLQIPSKDRSVFKRRAYSEGITFLTTTLAKYGKAVDHALVTGEIDFTDVKFKLNDEGYPLFLNHLVEKLPDLLIYDKGAEDIRKLRQLTLMYYKLEVPHDEATLDKTVEGFISRDRQLDHTLDTQECEKVRHVISRVLANADPFDIMPRHGSGAVSNKVRNCDKWHEFRFIPRLNACFPYDSHFFYNSTHLVDEQERLLQAEVVEEPPSRLVGVPKDSRGPRLICCEPAEFQYIQQGLMQLLYRTIESHSMTRGYVNFTDQTINRLLAEFGNELDLVTLDLSEASDRVSWDLVTKVFPSRWTAAFAASRSRFVQLPSGDMYGPLRKFAPMGSACCFPVEGLLFWSLLRSCLQIQDIWVYGDDIILPRKHARRAVDFLHKAGLRVNTGKSCLNTRFRESCGGDFFASIDIGYVNAKSDPRDDYKSWSAWVKFAENISEKFTLAIGLKVLAGVETVWNRPVPRTTLGPRPGCFYNPEVSTTVNDVFFKRRWSRDLQRWEYKVQQETPVLVSSRKDSKHHWCELLRKFLTKDGMSDPGTYATNMCKTRWSWTPL